MIFVESRLFTKRLPELLGDEGYRELQNVLARNPECGLVIPGCDGLRKIRPGSGPPAGERDQGREWCTSTYPKPTGARCF